MPIDSAGWSPMSTDRMTPEAKSALARTVRDLRERLLDDLHDATESAYKLGLRRQDARLGEAQRIRRQRFEDWIAEQVRSLPKKQQSGAAERFRREAEKQAAATLLNRIVYLRLLEASGLRREKVVTGALESSGFKQFRDFAQEVVHASPTEGYGELLQLVFDELALDLPGLFGPVGLGELIPIPHHTLRAVVEALDDEELASCWRDDLTLGWVYQFWNDPDREALDEKVKNRGKVEPHEIASKTQLFTERYMVDWLLQNSLGPLWLAICQRHGWTPEAEGSGALDRLEQRRAEWRRKREAGEVSLTELMPLDGEMEQRWAYYVPQPLPDDAVERAPESVRELRILDPAAGSGHFLVVAFDLLLALYQEEARHRGEAAAPQWSAAAVTERILEHNLHGIDLDPRAVQIAAAALWLKAQQRAPEARPRRMNLVASNLRLGALPADDPARRALREQLEEEAGIPAELTERLVGALAGADHLGSLLRFDREIEQALEEYEQRLSRPEPVQTVIGQELPERRRAPLPSARARATVLRRLGEFLAAHSHGDDLGLRLQGEQLAAGVRFVRLLREGQYHLVVANPPYQSTSKMSDPEKYRALYPPASSDLFAGMALRALELLRPAGRMAFITISNWMFLKSFFEFRQKLLTNHLVALADLGKSAFTTGGTLISTVCYVVSKGPSGAASIALRPHSPSEVVRDEGQPRRTQAALLLQRGRFVFDPAALRVVPEWPLIYWWGEEELGLYGSALLVGALAPVRTGMSTSDNARFVRCVWEVGHLAIVDFTEPAPDLARVSWVPKIMGAKGRAWFDELTNAVGWRSNGLEMKVLQEKSYGSASRRIQSQEFYFSAGIAFACIGSSFSARLHRFRGIFGQSGSSLFPREELVSDLLCLLNSTSAADYASALNPSISFQVGDVERLPFRKIDSSGIIAGLLGEAFTLHESHREPSVEFKQPGPSPWRHAQEWAQEAVDRPEGSPLPEYVEELDPEPPTDHLSFGLGVALGRFGAEGEGILDPDTADLSRTLPHGICFLDGTLAGGMQGDSLGHPATALLRSKWQEQGEQIAKTDLRTWLRLKFFGDVHKGMYENRPIHFPLSSARKTFVAHVSIHRWTEGTLRALLAEHLLPSLQRIQGEIADLAEARRGADKRAASAAEGRYADLSKAKAELEDFIAAVEQCAEKGPPPPDAKTPEREVAARYVPDLDDGVMVNSAALWPLLEPQWKDPKKWWKELCTAAGRKDYDWSHLAARYFPRRVDAKCQVDPSLAVAHGCFWKYHPENAYKWELRLQDEIGSDSTGDSTGDFTLDEDGSDAARAAFEREHPDKVEELRRAEEKRRERRRKKEDDEEDEQRDLELDDDLDEALDREEQEAPA
jgi:hypothetical protein